MPENAGGGRIDLAVIVLPVPSVMPVVRDCVKRNVRGILIESGNLSNDADEAAAFAEELNGLIAGKDIRVVGPNSIGFIEWYFSAAGQGQPLGVSNIAAIGNKLDVNECDLLGYYLDDAKTHAIGMYLEDIRDGAPALRHSIFSDW